MIIKVISKSRDGKRAAIVVKAGDRSTTVHVHKVAGRWLDKYGLEFPEVEYLRKPAEEARP